MAMPIMAFAGTKLTKVLKAPHDGCSMIEWRAALEKCSLLHAPRIEQGKAAALNGVLALCQGCFKLLNKK